MRSLFQTVFILLGLLTISGQGYSQFVTCDSNLINAHLNPAGYERLYVPAEPCSMYFYSTSPKYGIDAKRDAINLNVPQLVINDLTENNQVSAALFAQGVYSIAGSGSAVWLGITDSVTTFSWLQTFNGAPAPFFNWTAGDPNNLAPPCKVGTSCAFCFGADAYWCQWGEDCAVMNASGQWLDNTCQGTNVKRVAVLELNTCPVMITPHDTTICQGNSVNLTVSVASGGTPPYTYVWVPGPYFVQNITVSPTNNTAYTVEAIDHYQCKWNNTFSIAVNTVTTPVIDPSQAVACKGVNDTISLSHVSGTATYTWNFGPGAVVVSGTGGGPHIVNWSTGGIKTISVIVADSGCSTSATLNVTVDSANAAFTLAPPSVCTSGNVTAAVTSVSATAAYSWNWGGGTVSSGSGAGPYSVDWATPGTKTVGLTLTDNGCNATASATVNVVTPPSTAFTINPTSACAGQNVTVTVTSISGTATYAWSFGGGTVVSGSGAGPYTIDWATPGIKTVGLTVTDNGCAANSSSTVNIATPPSTAFTFNPTSNCVGQDVTVTVTSVSGTATYTWGWGGGTVVSGSGAGPYTVNWATAGTKTVDLTVTDNGCTANTSATINIGSPPSAAFTLNPTSTCAGQNVTATVTTVSATATYSWSWGGGTVVSGSGAGPYTVNWATGGSKTVGLTVTDNGCSANTTATENIGTAPSAAFTLNPMSTCTNQNVTATVTTVSATATYTWSFGGGTVVSGSGPGPYTIDWATAGTKTVGLTVSDNGCTVNTTQTVNINAATTPSFVLNPTGTACQGQPVSVTLSGVPSGTAVYTWSFGTGTILSGSGPGPYSISWNSTGGQNVDLTVTDGGCSGTASQSINIQAAATANAGPDIQICPGSPGNLGAASTAGYTYSWSPTFGLSNPSIANPTITIPSNPTGSNIDTFYVLTATTGSCSATDTVHVTLYPDINSNFTLNPTTTCTNSNVTVTYTGPVSGTATYTWNFNGATVVSGSGPGPYTINWSTPATQTVDLTVSDNGCSSNSANTIAITGSLTPAFTLNPSGTACLGQPVAVTLTGTASGTATYTWSFNGGIVASGSGPGPYSVIWNTTGPQNIDLTVTDGGCSGSATQSLTVINTPTADAGADIQLCPGITGNLGSASTAGYTYSWSPAFGLSDPTISNPTITIPSNPTGITIDTFYVVSVTSGSCTATDTVNVTIYPDINNSFTVSSAAVCTGDNVTVTYSGTPSGTATYNWNFNGANIVSGSNAGPYVINWTLPSTYTITLDVTDNGCTGTQGSQTVTVGLKPTAIAGADQTICSGDTIQLGAAAVAGVSYTWTPAAHLSNPAVSDPYFSEVNMSANPDVTHYMLIANGGGCQDTAYVNITDNPVTPIPVALSGPASFCQGDSVTLQDNLPSQADYTWSTGETTSAITVKISGTYTITAHDAGGCLYISIPSVVVTAFSLPSLSLAPNGEIDQSCTGNNDGSLTVQTTGGTPAYNYAWNTTPAQNTATASGLAPGSYQVMVTDNNGCKDTASYMVKVAPFIGINIDSLRNMSCYQKADGAAYASVTGGNPPVSYLWSTGAVTPSITHLNADTFSVTATDSRGCMVDTSVIITQPAPITFTTISDLHIAYGGNEQLDINITPSSNNYVYNWSPASALSCASCPSPVASPLMTTTYILTVTDPAAGCVAMDTITLNVNPSKSFYFPNTFTPNNDGINDLYLVFASGPVRFFEIEIFDRWGEKVYQSNDMGAGWDGTYRGVYVADGVYVYQGTITFLDGQTVTNRGSITVIK